MKKMKVLSVVLMVLTFSIFCKKEDPFDFSPGPPAIPQPIDATLTFLDIIDNKPLQRKLVNRVEMVNGTTYNTIGVYTTDDNGKIAFRQDPYSSGTFIILADDYLHTYTQVEAYLRPGLSDLNGFYPYDLAQAQQVFADTTKKSAISALVNRKAGISITLKQIDLIAPDPDGLLYYSNLFVSGFHPVTNQLIYSKKIELPVHLAYFPSLNLSPNEELVISDVAGDLKLKVMFNITKETGDGWDFILIKGVSDSLITKSNAENKITLSF